MSAFSKTPEAAYSASYRAALMAAKLDDPSELALALRGAREAGELEGSRADSFFLSLMLAALPSEKGGVEILRAMAQAGMKMTGWADFDRLPLDLAIIRNNPDACAFFISAGADPDESTIQSRSALESCCAQKNIAMARLLLERGANPNAATSKGPSPLHVAASDGCIEMCCLLLSFNANPRALYLERSPADLAREDEHFECAQAIDAFCEARELNASLAGSSASPAPSRSL